MLSRLLNAVGAAALVVSFALLVVSCVSIPNTSLPVFTVDVGRRINRELRSEIRVDFGLWGYCQSTYTPMIRFQEGCVKVNGPGYDPTEILSNITPSDFGSSIKTRGMRDLTPGFALPAVATAIAGLAMISSAIGVVKRNRVTPLVTTVLSALSLIFAAAAIGCVFGTFEKIRKAMRNHIILRTTERNGLEYRLSPRYGPCAITLVVACVILLVTTIIAACAWLASIREGRERRRNNVAEKHYSSDYESRASTTADH